MMAANSRLVLCDTHAHLHAGCDVSASWDAAYRNLSRFAAGQDFSALVFLADMAGQSFFDDLHASTGTRLGSAWTVSETQEAVSVNLTRDDGARITVIAGSQVVSRERIEVLLLGTRTRIGDGLPLDALLQCAKEGEGWTVLPWGVGKWTGKRGGSVDAVLRSDPDGLLWAGDNGNRPWFWPEPKVFGWMRHRRVPVLRGTDPLRIHQDTLRIGSFGNRIVCDFDPERPFGSVDKAIRSGAFEMGATGSGQGLLRFVANQIRLRLS